MKIFIKHATHHRCVMRAVKVAFVVGTVLALINHGDKIFTLTLTESDILKIILTYLVPYAVSSYATAMHARHAELGGLK